MASLARFDWTSAEKVLGSIKRWNPFESAVSYPTQSPLAPIIHIVLLLTIHSSLLASSVYRTNEQMKVLLDKCLFLVSLAVAVTAFQSPMIMPVAVSRSSRAAGHWTTSSALGVSSSADESNQDDLEDLMPSMLASSSSSTKKVDNDNDSSVDAPWVEWLVQGSIIAVGVALFYTGATSVLTATGDIAAALGDEVVQIPGLILTSLMSLLGTLAVAIWGGLQVAVPFIAKAVFHGVQAAIPVIQEGSKDFAEFAAPYVEEAKSEVAVVAAPYVDQLTEAISEAAGPTIVQPMQQATESLTRTIDASFLSPISQATDGIRQAVDANVVAPIQATKDTVTNAVDTTIIAPIQGVKQTLESVLPTNTFKDVANSVANTFDTASAMFGEPPKADAVMDIVDEASSY